LLFDVPDDELLIARARKGDTAAMEALYRSFETPVYNLGRHILSRPEEAEEVLQETFLEVFRSLSRYRGEGRLGAWIRSIAVSKALMRIRSRSGRSEEPLPDEDFGLADHAPSRASDTVLERVRLEAALAKLPEHTRAVVWLHDVEGFTHEEIAALFKKTASYSKSQLSRAHARLRGLMIHGEETAPCTRAATTW
jgi:RNA polymerase sigma factor (sigma-70 family)